MKFYTSPELLAELDNFSVEQLLEVKEKVDKLIQSKTSNTSKQENTTQSGRIIYHTVTRHPVPNNFQVSIKGSYIKATEVSDLAQDIDIVVSSGKQANNQSDMQALDSMIALVSEWQQDESGYDEEIYPNIEAALNQD
ncbi:hypothetical protein DSM106972_098110 [Dulcicalothrix desertica PCC 7102]|uniref:Uncharacterized protein n=1 Tax=Dulcicalothrix desertica PCC 7102 TaxID=232991 RepID=A0A3S1A3L0_9CYAN|nr:hypothetical protein [Dulcicalothrix desertica]RUS92792.1 hypothetical protein DSM106972_098110 [Dulcicalothrix desertica PCC 7102]TWH61453.1 hypothetical protein CAL7102_01020 [Dulcicalothrix desertica PCC 7102]